jgi:hypothetical protein
MAAVTNVDSIVEFAVYLQQSLLDENQGVNGLTVYLNALPLSPNDLSPSDRVKLSKRGVALWNICGRLRITEQPLSRNELLCQSICLKTKARVLLTAPSTCFRLFATRECFTNR